MQPPQSNEPCSEERNNHPIIVTFDTVSATDDAIKNATIESLFDCMAQLQLLGKKVLFAKQNRCFDIDTPGKDSERLFQAGLDYVMLVTDKQHYLKSRERLSEQLPLNAYDWVVQENRVYPETALVSVIANGSDDGSDEAGENRGNAWCLTAKRLLPSDTSAQGDDTTVSTQKTQSATYPAMQTRVFQTMPALIAWLETN